MRAFCVLPAGIVLLSTRALAQAPSITTQPGNVTMDNATGRLPVPVISSGALGLAITLNPYAQGVSYALQASGI